MKHLTSILNYWVMRFIKYKYNRESVRQRTEKIFYVCCTRAKENLAVFFHQPSANVIAKASEWFGAHNIVNLDEK